MQKLVDLPTQGSTSPEINPFEFPIGYFEAQVRFAQKWSAITGDDFSEVLFKKTALYRRISDNPAQTDTVPESWAGLLESMDYTTNPTLVSQRLYDTYMDKPNSKYVPSKHTGALGYDYQPGTQTVKIHFTNPTRGERPLSDENFPKRQEEFRKMLEDIRVTHPEAALLMSATWLRSTDHYRNLSPPDIAEQHRLPTDIKLTGNSVWGQFVDASGNINQRVYDQFVKAIENATTLDELFEAFPYKTLFAVDPIDKYYKHYGVIGTEK